MSKELIELTSTERFLANTGLTMTLKDVADRFGKRHNDLKNQFKTAVSKLTDENIGYISVVPKNINIKTGKGKIETINTFEMDLRTTLWLMTKYDENLRMEVINYAFEKLEEEKQIAVKKAKLPKVYDNGRMSVRGCIGVAFDDIKDDIQETDVWDALVHAGLAETKAKVTVKRTVPDGLDGIVGTGKYNMAVYEPYMVRNAYDKWIDAGKPSKTEYERLQEEFEQISKYYKEELDKARR